MTVGSDVAFIAVYGLVLVAAAWGLRRVGRINDPWSSRLFAAYRRETRELPAPVGTTDWPHSEAPRLYTGLGLVAAVAATLLCGAEAFRHHAPAELGLLALVSALGLASVARLARHLGIRAAARG